MCQIGEIGEDGTGKWHGHKSKCVPNAMKNREKTQNRPQNKKFRGTMGFVLSQNKKLFRVPGPLDYAGEDVNASKKENL